ncbi:MAG: DUF523 and DUF1722 domain-containing protein [Desulfobacteraceae bacterium]|nr:DUF523 and DUF1722 domain-containing protein [Desulfobacteraceae bacterium]
MIKPKIVVSRCLGFEKCRYNGETIVSEIVEILKKHADFITVCPEVEIGLGVPRDPVRVAESGGVKHLIQPASDKDYTAEINSWNRNFIQKFTDIDGFILKNRSPTCGIGDVKIYKGLSKTSSAYKGSGFFGEYVLDKFPFHPVEDEGRLLNYEIRDHFLVKLFAFTKFKQVKQGRTINDLNKFHSENKLLFMAYNQSGLKRLGKILASYNKSNKEIVFEEYEKEFVKIFSKKAGAGNFINVLQHAFGGMSDKLSSEEKKFFINSLEEFRDERIPLTTVTYLIHSMAVRFNNEYLINQTLLNPYPSDLIKTSDSGKKLRR